MVAPAIIGGLISAGGSIAGGLLNKKKSNVPEFNPNPLIEETKRGAREAKRELTQIRPGVRPIGEELQRRISELGVEGSERRRATADQFLRQLGRGTEAAGIKRANLLRQQILQAQPEQQQALLEAGAATGGVQRGATARALQANVAQNQAALNQLTSALDIGSQEAINNALSNIYQTEIGAQLRQQGVDEATAQYLAETGRADIIREFAGLADIAQNKSINIANLLQSANEAEAARALAQAQQQSGLLQSIIGGGLSTIGQIYGGRG